MTPSNIVKFLLARIAEDEASAHEYQGETEPGGLDRWTPDRIVADCEAKRRIVEVCTTELEPGNYGGEWAQEQALRALVVPYADHPDYRQEWR